MKTVYLSPSVQEKNIGVSSYGSEEKRMKQITDILEKILKQHGLVTIRNNPGWSLSQIVRDSNQKKPDIHFAIHSNAGGGRGCVVFCHKFGGKGEKLARAVYSELSPLTPTSDRGVKEGANLYGKDKPLFELAKTNAPATLVEIAFHDNLEDAQWIIANIEKIAISLAKGVLNYFGIKYVPGIDSLEEAVKVLEKEGIIEDPQYWLGNAVKGKSVDGKLTANLILKVATFLKGGKLK